MEYQCTRERFLKDIEKHEMKITKDDGVDRHITFKRPDSSTYKFDLITWSGYLCITGDMGCWVFSRIEDMFGFFIMSENDFNKKNIINPGYWEEKVQSVSKFGGPIKEFSVDKFKEEVSKYVKEYYEGCQEKIDECLEEINNDVFYYMDDSYPESTYQKLYDFSHGDFSFDRCPTAEIYTFYYIWVCYAIVWGIMEYNKKNI